MTRRAPATAVVLGGTAVLGVVLVALLRAWQGDAYIDFSDGVYAATARELLDGSGLYGDVVAAQPPLIYLYGVAALTVEDSVDGLRWAVGLALVAQAVLVALAVRRLTGARLGAVVAGGLSLLLPWTLREHGALLPEVIASPLLLGAALAASRRSGAVAAGALAALAVAFKLAFLLPAAAVLLVAVARGRALGAAVMTGAVLAAGTLLGYGGDAWENIVVAQMESGRSSIGYVAELWAHAIWNEGTLVVLAGMAWRLRSRSEDPALMRTLSALAVGATLLLLTLFKAGSFLPVLVVLEAPLLVLAAVGTIWLVGTSRRLAAAATVLAAVVAVQSVSLLVAPSDATLMKPPSSGMRPGWVVAPETLEHMVAEARSCPAGAPYSWHPWVAFAADRRMPGGQPDIWILESETHADKARAAGADAARCPAA